jgi:hypothetical protein
MKNNFPTEQEVERLRKQYPVGTHVELISMEDPYSSLRPGDKGRVSFIDSIGTIFVDWQSGSELGIAYGADKIKRIADELYASGAEMWRDTVMSYGREEAHLICSRYFDTQRCKTSQDEIQFCRELFAAKYEDKASIFDPQSIVYPFSLDSAILCQESAIYHENMKLNKQCATAINHAIEENNYELFRYNLENAARMVIDKFGFERTNWIAANIIRNSGYNSRYSAENKKWASGIYMQEVKYFDEIGGIHPIVFDSFVEHVRQMYSAVQAERFALPGQPENTDCVQGYLIMTVIRMLSKPL